MIIPIPCKLGEKALCNGRMLVFCGVDWFRWSSGMEYTYFFETGDFWHEADFYTGDGAGMSKYIEMDNVLLSSFVLRGKRLTSPRRRIRRRFPVQKRKNICPYPVRNFLLFASLCRI